MPASMRGLSQKWLHRHQRNLLPRANLRQDRLVAGGSVAAAVSPPPHPSRDVSRTPCGTPRRAGELVCRNPDTQATIADPQLAACSTSVETSVTTPADGGDLALGRGGTPSAPPRRSGNIRDPPPRFVVLLAPEPSHHVLHLRSEPGTSMHLGPLAPSPRRTHLDQQSPSQISLCLPLAWPPSLLGRCQLPMPARKVGPSHRITTVLKSR